MAHLFPIAGLRAIRYCPFDHGFDEQLQKTIDFLRSGNYMNVDLFALKDVNGGPLVRHWARHRFR